MNAHRDRDHWPEDTAEQPVVVPRHPPLHLARPIVIAANRLPVSRTPDHGWTPSPGGLVRA